MRRCNGFSLRHMGVGVKLEGWRQSRNEREGISCVSVDSTSGGEERRELRRAPTQPKFFLSLLEEVTPVSSISQTLASTLDKMAHE